MPRPCRLVDMSSDGRHVVLRRAGSLAVQDMHDHAPERHIEVSGLADFAVIGDSLWVVHGGHLERYPLTGGEPQGPTRLDQEPGWLWPSRGADGGTADLPRALWQGDRRMLLGRDGSVVRERRLAGILDDIPAGAFVRPAGQRGLLVAHDRTLRLIGFDQADRILWRLPATGRVLAAESLAGDRTFAALVDGHGESILLVLAESGAARYILHLPRVDLCTVADRSGIALVRTSPRGELMAVDLGKGKVLARITEPRRMAGMCLDRDARYLALAAIEHPAAPAGSRPHAGAAPVPDPALLALRIPFQDLLHPAGAMPRIRVSTVPIDPPASAAAGLADAPPPVDLARGDIPPLPGLGRPYRTHDIPAPPGNAPPPYDSPDQHLDDLLKIATLRTVRAIALAWHQGALHPPPGAPADLPDAWERTLRRYTGMPHLLRTPGILTEFDKRVFERHVVHVGLRTVASVAHGLTLPFADLCYNLDLSYPAAQTLLMAAAPVLRPDIARLFGILAADESRPLCDLALIEQILSYPGQKPTTRVPSAPGTPRRAPRTSAGRAQARLAARAATLPPAIAPLVQLGLARMLTATRDGRCYTPIVVEPIAIAYMRGRRFAGTGPDSHTSIHWAGHDLRALAVPEDIKHAVVALLAQPGPAEQPHHRVVLRGPAGAGRRSLAAALAGQLAKPLALIHCDRLAHAGQPADARLRRALLDAVVRSAIPMVSGLEHLPGPMEAIRAVLRDHPGTLFLRADTAFDAALEPGYASFTLPAAAIPSTAPIARPARAAAGEPGADLERLAPRPAPRPGRARHRAPRTSAAAPPRADCAWNGRRPRR